METKKLAIIGASYLQNPLIIKAKEKGIETHVFAWKCGDIGETTADYFYPLSIVEKEEILKKCQEIGIDGICSISSDLANITVSYVANKMGLCGNSEQCTEHSTNKTVMKEVLLKNAIPTNKGLTLSNASAADTSALTYPLIVKPTDRSGSRGITLLDDEKGLKEAIDNALFHSFEKRVIVEEFARGNEYSVECITYNHQHQLLSITKKYTTGSPNFVETGHLEPSDLDEANCKRVEKLIYRALDALDVQNGASHSEFKIDEQGNIRIIEIGSRMGGDNIGSHLVQLSTGFDFVNAVIETALGQKPDVVINEKRHYAAIKYIMNAQDIEIFNQIKSTYPEAIVEADIREPDGIVLQSGDRKGYYIICCDNEKIIKRVFANS